MLIDMPLGFTCALILVAMVVVVMLIRGILRRVIVGMLAIHNMRWDVVMHHTRDNLYTDDTSKEAANDCVCCGLRRKAGLGEVPFCRREHAIQRRE